jgi:hypothetical protein
MTSFDEEPDDFYPDDDDGYCDKCGGEGWILTCCDDMCHGQADLRERWVAELDRLLTISSGGGQ